mmetsp:Transcript_47908/g.124379  ORF Transcript_47908/g.124379 Transcript_47908/m.124379 type:complete len:270 (-) Transcript_47908:1088-1897(-)
MTNEFRPCPRQTVVYCMRKVVDRTVRRLLFWGIDTCSIVFRNMRNNDLNVTFGSKSAALKERFAEEDTSIVYVQPCFDVVKRIDNTIQAVPELVIKNMFSVWRHSVLHRNNVKRWVHLCGTGSRSRRFWLPNVPVSEKELPRQIGSFNYIVICNNDFSAITTNTHHRKILQELTSQSTSTNHKILKRFNALLNRLAEHIYLSIVARAISLKLIRNGILVRKALHKIHVKELKDGMKLATARFNNFLACNSTIYRSHRRQHRISSLCESL